MTQPKSRRRGAELEAAILDAAWEELREVGYGRLTIEGVAARAGTSKPVIYRRWPGRPHLVLAAWNARSPSKIPVVQDTGTLREDLILLFGSIARRANEMLTEMAAGVMSEAFRHPEIGRLLKLRLNEPSPMTEAVEKIVGRAVERGELPPIELPHRTARLPLVLIRSEYPQPGNCFGEAGESVIEEIVDDIYLPLLKGLSTTDPDK
ncbi:TetR/AcrR family transcriptional regulator [Saccharothrix violaceirubra]|uniref:AcrR family transcriptional regulator n=1 Tax=Saccharothrix violaceirubra TaxID=413306 RepID=A0A7W7T274_9PSEU|nr:TetR/AcrR family transcriptional regulator [Saccharothrix violaceirubra]MBB4965199.1 AcrR family transcriptional regulator [Saccharothrix violaceirubra]